MIHQIKHHNGSIVVKHNIHEWFESLTFWDDIGHVVYLSNCSLMNCNMGKNSVRNAKSSGHYTLEQRQNLVGNNVTT